jgi:hypothetical protein
VTYRNGKITPPPGIVRIDRGAAFTLSVASDTPEKVTVQGYPQAFAIASDGMPAEVDFVASKNGTFRITLQPGNLLVTVLEVQ